MQTETVRVFWKGKFDGKAVLIDKAGFNPTFHRHEADGPFEAAKPAAPPAAQNPVSAETSAVKAVARKTKT